MRFRPSWRAVTWFSSSTLPTQQGRARGPDVACIRTLLDHAKLFDLMSATEGDFLMTYDNDARVLEMAREHGFETHAVAMKSTHHARMTELLVGRSLSWLD